jgi:hypothetical protein
LHTGRQNIVLGLKKGAYPGGVFGAEGISGGFLLQAVCFWRQDGFKTIEIRSLSAYRGKAKNSEYQMEIKQKGRQQKSNRRSFDSPPPI